MSDGGFKVLDGAQLSVPANLTLLDPGDGASIDGERVLELAESKASELLYGFSLPDSLKSLAIRRLDPDPVNFRSKKLDGDEASRILRDYISAIADELSDDPVVIAILDGKVIKKIMEDEDDFAMLAENVFTDLDSEDDGKVSKHKVRSALELMGVEMGVPPFSEFSPLNGILIKHGAEGDEKLGQSQFAEVLQPVLQELADALAAKPLIVIQNIKIINGSKLKKLLNNEDRLNEVIEKIYQEQQSEQEARGSTEIIKSYLEKNGKELGLPPLSEANDAVSGLFDSVFAEVDKEKCTTELEMKEFGELVRDILTKFAKQLKVDPVFQDLKS